MSKPGNKGLDGLKVLVTRPARQSRQLSDAIRVAGGHPVEMPMLEIRVLPENPSTRDKVLNLDRYDIVIAVSANAAKIGLDLVNSYWPQLPAHIIWLTVGPASGKLLADYGIDARFPQQGANSEGLLRMPELQQVQGLRILIMKGMGGRQLLAQMLAAAGARIDEMELYHRDKPAYSNNELKALLNRKRPDVVLATSVNILDNLEAIISPLLASMKSLPLIVASDRIAEHARLLGFNKIIIADDASDQAILKAINNLS